MLVVIPTRGRRDIVPALERLEVQAADVLAKVEVAILDNSGGAGFDGTALTERFGCQWFVVPEPGLARVRNTAIDLLQPWHEALIFLDDDERPESGWLNAMLTTHSAHRASVVLGPVRAQVPNGAPSWLLGGTFLRAVAERPDGRFEGEAYSGNTLIDATFLRRTGLRFDGRFDQTGGEDTDFFRRLREAGGCIFWAQDAAVIESVDAERATIRGVIHRAFHAANLSWRLDRAELSLTRRSRMFLRRAGRLPRGAGRLTAGVAAGRADRVMVGLCDCAAAAGTLTSALGYRTRYYR